METIRNESAESNSKWYEIRSERIRENLKIHNCHFSFKIEKRMGRSVGCFVRRESDKIKGASVDRRSINGRMVLRQIIKDEQAA